MIATILAVVAIAFPGEGQRLPAISRCYVIGSRSGNEQISFQGQEIAVHERGGWVAMAEVQPGTNTVIIGDVRRTFYVEIPRQKQPETITNLPTKTYSKLEYSKDQPRERKTGGAPSEYTIVLDAGHGGGDDGAISPHSLPEKDANLRMALAVRRELEARGVKVVMTRTSDETLDLYERPRKAHEIGADAFISIHHNAPPANKDPRELRYHAVFAWNKLGEELAKPINLHMAAAIGDAVRNNGVVHANFAVTRSEEIPSCLIEVDFVTTPESELDVWSRERRNRIARSIADGIAEWCGF